MSINKYYNIKYDVSFKKVFGNEKNKDITISFLNDILRYEGDKIIEDLEILNGDQLPHAKDRKSCAIDVMCRDKAGKQYIIEMQLLKQTGFAQRLEFYASKAYSEQLFQGEEYNTLRPVVSIAITDFIMAPELEECISYHKTLDTKTSKQIFKSLSYVLIELPKFKKERIEDLNGIVEKWCYFFKHSDDIQAALQFEESDGLSKSDAITKAYHELEFFNWDESERAVYERELKDRRDMIALMKTAERNGEEKGRAEGRAEGELAGELKAKREFARKLLAAGGMSYAQIAAITELPEDEIDTLAH